jgi:hypothetical protein
MYLSVCRLARLPQLPWMVGRVRRGENAQVGLLAHQWLCALIGVHPGLMMIFASLLLSALLTSRPDVTYQTYEEKDLEGLQTISSDGTRAISRWNRILHRWETTITSSPSRSEPDNRKQQ